MEDKVIPQDIRAEECVCGSILVDSESYYKVLFLQPDDFSLHRHKVLFSTFKELADHGMPCNQVTVAHVLADKKQVEEAGGISYLSYLIGHTESTTAIVYYAEIVKRCADYQRLLKTSLAIENIAYAGGLDFDKSLADCMKLITGLKKSSRSKVRTPKDRANSAMDMYQDYANGTTKRTYFGIPSLDKIGGMAPGEYIILCGETEMGKTTCAKQITDHVAQEGTVLYFTGEMTEPQWNQRDIARILHQPMRQLSNQEYIKDHLDDILRATGKVSEGNIYTMCGNVTPDDIYTAAVNIEGIKLIVIDYLQLVKGVTADYKATSQASSQLSRIAKELEVPMLVLSQLSRDNATKPEDKKHWMQRLKDSGNIENDADWVLNISRDKEAKLGTKGFREATLAIGKHRQGGERIKIPLEFDYNEQIYLEVSRLEVSK